MIWPEWLTEARIAIVIASLSAAFTLWQARSAHVQTRITKQAAKRKDLICEPRISGPMRQTGKRHVAICIKNLEPYAATITAVKIMRSNVKIVRDPMAYQNADADQPSRLQPFNIRVPGGNAQPVYIKLIADGDLSYGNIRVVWEWLDGTRR